MSDREEFEKWADGFDHEAREWLDMDNEKVFEAGYKARQPEFDALTGELGTRNAKLVKANGLLENARIENAALKSEMERLRGIVGSAHSKTEGWPTDEMTQAGFAALPVGFNRIGYDVLQSVFKAMLAAAPTPPAQPHYELDDADIRAIALDCGLKLKPPPYGLEDLNPWVYRFAREILSTIPRAEDVESLRERLTPPAQEGEPVGYVFMSDVGMLFSTSREWCEKTHVQAGIGPIREVFYTHPANDKLRKAAEEVIREFDLSCRESACYGSVERIENLRAALEGK